MENKKEIFADGIGQIHFVGGMVRFDYVTLQPGQDGAAPTPEGNIRIIMMRTRQKLKQQYLKLTKTWTD